MTGFVLDALSLKFEDVIVDGYERVVKVTESGSGLQAIIAVHSTVLGPALGGIRIQKYESFDAALKDVLRLARGMTYKSAAAGLGLGGGKSVILADPKTEKTPELLRAFGAAVEALGGTYICAEDMGCTTEDVRVVRSMTKYVVGLADKNSSGDPAPFTAWGTLRGIQSVCGGEGLEGKRIAIQGLGSVGSRLAELLFWAGAELIVCDLDGERAARIGAQYGARVVDVSEILRVECDVLAPCAGGAILNDRTILGLRCKAVAGCANNQLLHDSHGDMLRERGILYAPDFVINSGGLINVSVEIEVDGYNPRVARGTVHRIYDVLRSIYERAESEGISTHRAAMLLAEHRLQNRLGKRVEPATFHHSSKFKGLHGNTTDRH